MDTRYQYVSKCSCCDHRYTTVNVPYMDASHLENLSALASEVLIEHGFNGHLSIQCAGTVVTNFYYEYLSDEELISSNLLFQLLMEVAQDYSKELSDDGINWAYHRVKLCNLS